MSYLQRLAILDMYYTLYRTVFYTSGIYPSSKNNSSIKNTNNKVTIYDDNAAHPWGTPSDSDEFRCNLLLESLQEELTGAQ